MRRYLLLGLLLVAVVFAGLSFWVNRIPRSEAQIATLADRLFEFGAIDFVHGAYDGPKSALFACVGRGGHLTPQQSVDYRTAYQGYLFDRQALFVRLDADLQLRQDFEMADENNVGGHGISGLHDQHDLSAMANIADIADQLARLDVSKNPITRAWLANGIYKDLTDLMVHLAPAIHSVGLLPSEAIPETVPDAIAAPFSGFYAAMKEAQAVGVNSPAYWAAVDRALGHYAKLVQVVQDRVRARNGAVSHALSGQWLSIQTIAPNLGKNSPISGNRRAYSPLSCT